MSTFVNRLVRVLKIGAVVGAAAGIARAIRGTTPPETLGQASWQPLTDPPESEPRTGPVQFTAPPASADDAPAGSWLEPVDGVCPASHPIKGNAQSGIFHVPGGMSYERTVPERCYASEADAEADGFRKAKR
ncbi:MAG: hypothetical protein DHS20C19_24410 [Acidimicrobiales bacterium]|nr:MAG: hypothetical protein DHS20C19_24410 [Acidimicrobiales bacterium]